MVATVSEAEMRHLRRCSTVVIDIISSFAFQPLCPLSFNSAIRIWFTFDRDSFHTMNVLRKAHERKADEEVVPPPSFFAAQQSVGW